MKTEDRGLRMEDGKLGSEESPVDKGCPVSERGAQIGMNRWGAASRFAHVAEKAKNEVLRFKTTFRVQRHPEGWPANREENCRTPRKWQTSNIQHRTLNIEWKMGNRGRERGRKAGMKKGWRLALYGDSCRLIVAVALAIAVEKPRGHTAPATLWSLYWGGFWGDLLGISGCMSGLPKQARMSAVQPAEHGRSGNCSLISSCFHLFPLASAVLIIKIIFGMSAVGWPEEHQRGPNSAKLA